PAVSSSKEFAIRRITSMHSAGRSFVGGCAGSGDIGEIGATVAIADTSSAAISAWLTLGILEKPRCFATAESKSWVKFGASNSNDWNIKRGNGNVSFVWTEWQSGRIGTCLIHAHPVSK